MAEKLQRLAKSKGMTQDALEAAAGLPKSRISKWAGGKGEPSARQALRLARILDVPLEYLVDDSLEEMGHESSEQVREILKLVRYVGGFDVAVARLTLAETIQVEGPNYGEIREQRRRQGGKDGGRRPGA